MEDLKKVIVIRYSEIFLKGKNFGFFEKKLLNNIKEKLSQFDCDVLRTNKRFLVENFDAKQEKKIVNALLTVFGICSISVAVKLDTDLKIINDYVSSIKIKTQNFRVTVNRADKRFPITSIDYSKSLGGIILKNNSDVSVDLHNPQTTVFVDIRENGYTLVYTDVIDCLGGMPVGTSGSGLLLLSGGIDSPVAGYMMARRGMAINALHFHSYPYTSENAKNKVIELAGIIKKYTGSIKLHIVSFTHIQEAIHKHCDGDFMITLMRRIMYRIAERLALQKGYQCIITGENLGQVASQTVESMTVTNAVVEKLPIFRPLISFDKEDISNIAVKIGTFDTSILPYEDCCTVFLPKHPVIKPKLEKCLKEESKLDIDALIDEAMSNIEVVEI
ncbi:MAG: tRNA uracil 4-sulfurtransferase ThiI [Eubacteriales bacterium]|nr:tRNA uracil 4-sulfurtransferase ThiI [Eubacteriales bacterium]